MIISDQPVERHRKNMFSCFLFSFFRIENSFKILLTNATPSLLLSIARFEKCLFVLNGCLRPLVRQRQLTTSVVNWI